MLWFLLFLLLAAAIVVAYRARQHHEGAQSVLVALLVLTLALSLVRIFRSGSERDATAYDPEPERILGRVAAEEFARLAREPRVVLIAQPDTGRRVGGQIKTREFVDAARNAGIEIVARISPTAFYEARSSDPDEREEAQMMLMDVGVDSTSVQYAIEQHPDVQVIISLAGVPFYGGARVPPPVRNRQVLAVDWYSAGGWFDAMAAGALDAVIANRVAPATEAMPRRPSQRDIFDRHYILVTPDTLDAVRDEIRTPDTM